MSLDPTYLTENGLDILFSQCHLPEGYRQEHTQTSAVALTLAALHTNSTAYLAAHCADWVTQTRRLTCNHQAKPPQVFGTVCL